jgi:hypothetical protein
VYENRNGRACERTETDLPAATAATIPRSVALSLHLTDNSMFPREFGSEIVRFPLFDDGTEKKKIDRPDRGFYSNGIFDLTKVFSYTSAAALRCDRIGGN